MPLPVVCTCTVQYNPVVAHDDSAPESIAPLNSWELSKQLLLKDRALAGAAEGITIADARLPERPLIYVNDGFERLTGYRAEDILGTNCRFLQGEATDPATTEEIRQALRAERPCTVEILNYRRDGSQFWNRLSITPVRDESGTVTHFIGIQSDITSRRRAEDSLRAVSNELAQANEKMQHDLNVAARIQRSLLPTEIPEIPGVTVHWRFLPCEELAGDTLGVIPIGGDRLAVFVIDVSGHGVPAALLSVTLTHWLSGGPSGSRLLRSDGSVRPPSAVLDELNAQFPMDPSTAQYFTMFYATIDLASGELVYASAGHPPALHITDTGDVERLGATGVPVGVVSTKSYEQRRHWLGPRDRLYVYTDGLIEAERAPGQQIGVEGVEEHALAAMSRPLDRAVIEIMEACSGPGGPTEPADDLTLLAIERS